MANSTKCLTQGATYRTLIDRKKVYVSVELPFELDIDEEEAEVLDILLHNQVELVLRSYFKDKGK